MNLIEKLDKQILAYGWQTRKIIVALSGGLDSMCLAALLHDLGLSFVLAHCNFGLRGEESDGDEIMVKEWAEKRNIPLFVKHFNVPKILEEQGGNLEERARTLRYDWFEQLRKELNFDLIATAHHQQDNIETLLMNFFRGTGIAGLHGILPEQGQIIRPLLTFKKEELKNFAITHQIPWREDSSNAQDAYLRNKIRHQLWPEIQKIFPQSERALCGNIERFREAETLFQEAIENYRKKLIEQRQKDWYLSILKLRSCQPLNTILYELLQPFGFSPAQMPDVLHLIDAESGKWVASQNYRILKDRGFLIISAIEARESTMIKIEYKPIKQTIEWQDYHLDISILSVANDIDLYRQAEGHVLLHLQVDDFPLYLRPIRDGDYFYPLGLQRKKKKVGRFLRDVKMPLHEKQRVWVLESKRRIVWVLGFRIDERFKVQGNKVNIVQLCLKKDKLLTGK